jgi:hypothetical protein
LKTNWKFYCNGKKAQWSADCAFIAANKRGGHLFYKNGVLRNNLLNQYYSLDVRYSNVIAGHDKEISLNKALSLITDKSKIKDILKFLNIKEENKIEISEEIKNKVINYLTESRAFNQDSALKVDDKELDVYDALAEKGIINYVEREDRFYFSEKSI